MNKFEMNFINLNKNFILISELHKFKNINLCNYNIESFLKISYYIY